MIIYIYIYNSKHRFNFRDNFFYYFQQIKIQKKNEDKTDNETFTV